MDAIKKMKHSRTYAMVFGWVMLVLYWNAEGNQGVYLIVGGISLLLACFDEVLILMAENRDPDAANPLLFIIVVLLILLMIAIPFGTAIQAVHYFKADNNISYTTKKDYAVVNQVYGGDTVIELADSYKDKPVTVIANNAFWGRDKVTEVEFPKTLKEIKTNAFWGCTSLTEITLPDGLETIGKAAFSGCKNLKHVTIPASVTKIDRRAFRGCPKELVIAGQSGSEAEAFAAKAKFSFEAISDD